MKQQVYNNMDTTEDKVQGMVRAINLLIDDEQDKAEAIVVTKTWFMIIGTARTKEVIEEAKSFSQASAL